jgi:hypothetical protein
MENGENPPEVLQFQRFTFLTISLPPVNYIAPERVV